MYSMLNEAGSLASSTTDMGPLARTQGAGQAVHGETTACIDPKYHQVDFSLQVHNMTERDSVRS